MESAYIEFQTHSVVISLLDSGKIGCFKTQISSTPRSDYQMFDNQETATEWIVEPFPSITYKVIVKE